jgi:hypothetical protein
MTYVNVYILRYVICKNVYTQIRTTYYATITYSYSHYLGTFMHIKSTYEFGYTQKQRRYPKINFKLSKFNLSWRNCEPIAIKIGLNSGVKLMVILQPFIISTRMAHFFLSLHLHSTTQEELEGAAVSALRRAIVEVKQRWSVIGWVTNNLLTRASPCFGRHFKPLGQTAFAVVSTHQPALGPSGGLWAVLLMCNP